jgi:UrcA family protein
VSAKIQFTTLAIAAMLAFGASAQAAARAPSEPETFSMTVSVADLDLRQAAGLVTARKRIHRAAVLVCGNEPASSGLARYAASGACRKAAFAEAMADLDTRMAASPRATALAANR